MTNQILAANLATLKEAHTYLIENMQELKNTDLHREMRTTKKLIRYLYIQKENLTRLLSQSRFTSLQSSLNTISEIIEVLHNILRILQKNTLKLRLANRSIEATLAVNRSQKTMAKLYH